MRVMSTLALEKGGGHEPMTMVSFENWKMRGAGFTLVTLEESQPCWHADLKPYISFLMHRIVI